MTNFKDGSHLLKFLLLNPFLDVCEEGHLLCNGEPYVIFDS